MSLLRDMGLNPSLEHQCTKHSNVLRITSPAYVRETSRQSRLRANILV